MTRRQARIQALQLLYSREINPEAEKSVFRIRRVAVMMNMRKK